MQETSTTCPLLKKVVMLYCDACPTKKMLPLDHLVSARPCQASQYGDCSFYQEAVKRLGTDVLCTEPPAGAAKGGPMIATVPLVLLFVLLLLNDRAFDRAARARERPR